ncbi:MAG: hypothetical protein JRF07_03535, partial [Deltaproteobacteria bacterium]|nr:hypothetical protein [Deltaproteobacteria bacterium]
MPEIVWPFAALIIGLFLGFLPAMLFIKSSRAAAHQQGRQEMETELAILQERLASAQQQVQHHTSELGLCQQKLDQCKAEQSLLEAEKARLTTQLQEEVRRSEEKLSV